MSENYRAAYARSLAEPGAFWLSEAARLEWDTPPASGFDPANGAWFPGGMVNLCHNAVDRHVDAGRGAQTALIYESPVTGTSRRYTFSDLQEAVSRTAGMMVAAGAKTGDRVVIYMPMIPEAVFAMLACARIGCVHSVVFGGFSAPELAKRIDDSEPAILLTASCGIEGERLIPYKPIIDEALVSASHDVSAVIVLQRDQCPAKIQSPRDRDWAASLAAADPADCVTLPADHPLYILYTSGTTGKPKGVVREAAGYAVALAWSMGAIYGVAPGETYWAASDIGWVVGHSYIVYGPLLNGNATVLYEGKPVGTPDAGIFWRIVSEHDVKVLFTAPTAIRAIRSADPEGKLLAEAAPGCLRALFLAGERADPDTVEWIGAMLDRPVIDHWWQTELGWPALATCFGLGVETAPVGSAGYPVPGFAFEVLNEKGRAVEAGTTGNLAIREPMAPGAFRALWRNEAGFRGYFTAFEGYYATGDAGVRDPDGSYRVMGRTDDIINVAGHRLSTGQIEETVAACPSVVECAVIGGADELKGEVPVVFYVAADPGQAEDLGKDEIGRAIRRDISPIAAPRDTFRVAALPKTRSGKILRNLLRAVVNGDELVIPQTIENSDVVDALIEAVRDR